MLTPITVSPVVERSNRVLALRMFAVWKATVVGIGDGLGTGIREGGGVDGCGVGGVSGEGDTRSADGEAVGTGVTATVGPGVGMYDGNDDGVGVGMPCGAKLVGGMEGGVVLFTQQPQPYCPQSSSKNMLPALVHASCPA